MLKGIGATRIGVRWGLAVLFASCVAVLLMGAVSAAQTVFVPAPQTGNDPTTVDPWEVILYEHSNYTGTSLTYRIEPGMRQKLVPQIYPGMEDKVTSIRIGSKVGVYLFAGRNFYAGGRDDRMKYDQSISKVEVDFKVGSLIVYPKAAEGPLGVWLFDLRYDPAILGLFDATREISFFPLPESEGVLEREWGFLGDRNLEKNANWVELDARYMEVTLYEGRDFQGASLTLPGAGPPQSHFAENLGPTHGWSDRAASLRVRWTGPPLAMGPTAGAPAHVKVSAPPTFTTEHGLNLPGQDYKRFAVDGGPQQCENACASEAQCKAFTWVRPGVQGPKAMCWLKSGVPGAMLNPDTVSGYSGMRPQVQGQQPPSGGAQVPEPGPGEGTDAIKGFAIVRTEGLNVLFRIDYRISPSHGPVVYVGTWLYGGGQSFGGYTPAAIPSFGDGSVEQWLTLPPEPRTSDEVEFFFSEPAQQPFVKARFPLKQAWPR